MMPQPTLDLPAAQSPMQPILAAFEAFEKSSSDRAPAWLRTLRTSGVSYFIELGFPAVTQEEWRFTNPEPLASFPFVRAGAPDRHDLTASDLEAFRFGALKGPRLVFVDGWFVPELSSLVVPDRDVTIASLATALRWQPNLLESRLGRIARHEDRPLTALNTAFLQDGAFIQVPAGTEWETPIHLLFVSRTPGAVVQPRNLIVAEARSRVRVIEDYVSLHQAASFTNAVTEIVAGPGAWVEHVKIQRENTASLHVAAIEAQQARDSRVLSHSISLGARLARNDINLRFQAEGCESVLNGLYFAGGGQLTDHHTLADHASPHCASHEFYHGILAGQARGVFNGRILVRPDAQKTDAKQTNRNLLLSDEATVNTKPQLEIFADDVKCTHGATVGQLDEDAMFYLRSRGIGQERARQMLIQAFASDVLNRITIEPVRQTLDALLAGRLRELTGGDAATC
jgi:Fe-S cluster assembly protein SufD